MKLFHGTWLPSHEKHFLEWMVEPKNRVEVDGKLTYQHAKQVAALSFVKNWRCAVDIGGHVGFWSRHLVKRFERVHAFEPVEAHRECFVLNVDGATLHPVALGAAPGMISMWTEDGSSGNSIVKGSGDIEMRTLDSYGLEDVDFIKIDCEGYELFVLQGAVETLRRCRPTICVEQKPGRMTAFGLKGAGAVTFLEEMGAVVREKMSGDYILTWESAS